MSKDFQNVLNIAMNMIWETMYYPVLIPKAIRFTERDLKIIFPYEL
jgi:hypothetical protein